MPLNTPDDVARQIVQCVVDTSLNGRVVYVAGGRGFDTEAGVVATQGTWMGEENCAIWNRGQEILGSVSLFLSLLPFSLSFFLSLLAPLPSIFISNRHFSTLSSLCPPRCLVRFNSNTANQMASHGEAHWRREGIGQVDETDESRYHNYSSSTCRHQVSVKPTASHANHHDIRIQRSIYASTCL